MEEANSQHPLGLTPVDPGTQANDGTETPSETGQPAASEETVHPEGDSNASDDGSTQDGEGEGTDPPEAEPFHTEGDRVFKTKEDYITYVNRQRGAASDLAHAKSLAEQEAQHFKRLYETSLEALGKNGGAQAQTQQPEVSDEVKEAMKVLENAGFIRADDAKKLVEEAVKPFNAVVERERQERLEEARRGVDEFLALNPDAADVSAEMQQILLGFEKAGTKGGLKEAYFIATGKVAKTESDVQQQTQREVKQAKAAQAGGAPSGKSAPAGKGRDVFDGILSSQSPSLT